MGLSQEFYAGDPKTIEHGFDAGDPPRKALDCYADFSLHLSPTDLDILSEVIAESIGVEPVLLNDSLGEPIADDAEHGIHVVELAWVRMVAQVVETQVAAISAIWIRRVGQEAGQELSPTPDSERAVSELIRLCKGALSRKTAVVYLWYL